MAREYCSKCEKHTYHVRQNSGGEVAAKLLVGFITMGMSIGATPTVYECTQCGSEKEK